MFGLYVKFTARPGQRDTLVALLLGAAKRIEGSPGCQLYIIRLKLIPSGSRRYGAARQTTVRP
jgi:quinol monooxygenase YgiN